ncbi:arylesterase [Brevundimonas sp. LM2]|uniref:arylesterase n=1 Tax=Brevundimonas sp. LM2 TaxID=1938605 RepID=UPI0009840591|nr:arylesterase [Brevundimonas sp. LM2]AQR61425.1 arylesterase [Brevundimonas sp. LM2]
MPPQKPVVTLLGDSISAGYGLQPDEALPARLQVALADLGQTVEVVGAGIDGDTTLDGLARMDIAVPMQTDLCVVALGANDLMQARPPAQIAEALGSIVSRLQACQTEVLLCGMRAPPWLSDYAPAFDAVFPTVAERHAVPLYPFLLEGVALDPRFNQSDRIHPNAEGIDLIARRLAPAVRDALVEARAGAR